VSTRVARSAGALPLHRLLRRMTAQLRAAGVSYGHGTTNARDEAAWLTLHALGLPLDESDGDLLVSPDGVAAVEALIAARIRTRQPAAYLLNEAWLGDYRFYVDERVIVPRSFIAELLLRDRLAPWIAAPGRVRSVLDLCTGSGCLAILAALTFPRAAVDAADISRDALDVAKRNIADYELASRVRRVRVDLFKGLGERRYDVIVTNPPYVTAAAMAGLPTEYRREPRLALAGGRDGLDLVRRILADAPDHLEKNGWLVVEVGHARARVERAFPRLPLIWAATSAGDDCVFLVNRAGLLAARTATEPSGSATSAVASPRRRAAPATGRASGATAASPRRNARASGGSR